MLDLHELEHFVAFKELGTLSRVSEHYHISTPSVTRSMQHIEEYFGVSLFHRSKNRLELNQTGEYAAVLSQRLLDNVYRSRQEIQNYDKQLKTIFVSSAAPAPLWKLMPELNMDYPGMTIASSISDTAECESALRNESSDIIILPYDLSGKDHMPHNYSVTFYMSENLSICVTPNHELADRESVSFDDINGYNFLLRSELGFWDTMCREKMPSSRFLVQTDDFEFGELIRTSSLPSFVTDVTMERNSVPDNRITIPITDPCAQVKFYLYRKKK